MKHGLVVGYVVKAFPLPSETFVTDEAASLEQTGADAVILHLQPGDDAVVHDSARALIARKATRLIDNRSRHEVMSSLLQLLRRRPLQTALLLMSVARSAERWRHARAIPHALWCLERGVTYLHAHFADVNLEYAAIISRWSGIPYGLTTHRYDLFENPLEVETASLLMRKATLHVTISQFNRGVLEERFGIPRDKVHVVHCGIDLARFSFVPRPKFSGERPFRVLNVGRLVPVKGHEILIRALAMLQAEGRNINTQIVGSGPERGRIEALIAEAGLNDRVSLVGAQPHDEVARMLAEADAFVMSSHVEGIPVACMETMARGTPTIATRTNGVPELIDHEVSGLLVPPNEPAAIAQAIARLMDHPTEAQSMAQEARRKIEREFNRSGCTEQLVSLFMSAAVRQATAFNTRNSDRLDSSSQGLHGHNETRN